MNKLFSLMCIIVSFLDMECFAQSVNPIVTRVPGQEIAECKTPAAVAYNFVIACLNKDKSRMLELATDELKDELSDNFQGFLELFSEPSYSKLYIESWLPIPAGCEIAVLYVQSETPSNYLPGTLKKVYVDVVPSREIGNVGFQDITRMSDTNVKVLVENVDGRWKVMGFK